MQSAAKRLIGAGFINKKYKGLYRDMSDKEKKNHIKHLSDSQAKKEADGEYVEVENNQWDYTGYPPTVKKYRMIYESMQANMEESYFWIKEHIKQDQGFHYFTKIVDIFSATESSSFWGVMNQRLMQLQDKVGQFMGTIANMVKTLFQIVREIRVIDERLAAYHSWKESKAADLTLKGLFIDQVEGASKNPTSVYGLAQTVGFTILPDLFFNTQAYSQEEIEEKVEAMDYNIAVKNILKRKLFQYVTWKLRTEEELENRRSFTIKYLRQHWDTIKMYMSWIKPHIKSIKRMQMNQNQIDSADMISGFETGVIEIEFLAKQQAIKGVCPVIVASFFYRTVPKMDSQKEWQRGAIHIGRIEFNLRAYTWTEKQIAAYIKMRDEEDLELLGFIDGSVEAAMEALGDDLKRYLKEAGGEDLDRFKSKDEVKKRKKRSIGLGALEPFVAIFKGIFEIADALIPISAIAGSASDAAKRRKKSSGSPPASAYKSAKKAVTFHMYQAYKNYKKAHKMLSW